MLVATEGIVLHSIKYGESSIISTIFTNDFGRQSYLINSARSKNSKNKASLLQPLFLVDLIAYQKQSNELHRVKEIKSTQIYQTLSFDIMKSTISIFLAEILYKSINEQESYPEMFGFIKNSLLYFDLMETGFSNFHIWFLLRLTEYLGFLPDMNRVGYQNWFDMKKGEIVAFQPSHPFYANKELTEFLANLSVIKIHELAKYPVPRTIRDQLVTIVVDYYRLHFENLGEIKSLNVLREIFK